MPKKPRSYRLFWRADNPEAEKWVKKLSDWLKTRYPNLKEENERPDLIIVLGGDGAILEAARKYQSVGSLILGLNLGTFGFLAAAQANQDFLPTLKAVLVGKYQVVERMMIDGTVVRSGKAVFKGSALNDVVVTSPLSIVGLKVQIDDHTYQFVRGSGVLVATATGSTAYNLSAHGPIVMPAIKCLVLTEILDHNVPTPSIVIEPSRTITVKVEDFRAQNLLAVASSTKPADVVVTLDGDSVFPLEQGDKIIIRQSPKHSLFVQVDKNHFFTGLADKFALK